MPERDALQIERTRRALVRRRTRLELGRLVVLAILVLSVWVVSSQGRSELVKSQRIGCQRGLADRQANARGWRSAQAAREATANDSTVSPNERSSARRAAKQYAELAGGLEARARIDCSQVYPDPGPFALH